MKGTSASNDVEVKTMSALQSPWILGMLGFMAITVAVNLTMAYLAITTSPGLVATDFYDRGQNFEVRTAEERLSRNSLGWSISFESPSSSSITPTTQVRAVIRDKSGAVMKPDKVEFLAYRPSNVKSDFKVPMKAMSNGDFVADVTFPLAGVWDTIIEANHGDVQVNIAKRMIVKKS